MRRAIVVHGLHGKPHEAWFPWLKAELEKRKFYVSVPQMPSPSEPHICSWVSELAQKVGSPDKDTILIGHSLGCITILHYLESLQEGRQIGGAVFISGFASFPGIPETSSFFSLPLNWQKIKSRCKKFVVINSDNDKYVSLVEGRELAERLGTKMIIEKGLGHMGEGDKCRELPSALKAALGISN